MIGGGVLVTGGILISLVYTVPTASDIIGGIAVVVTTATLGLALRSRAGERARELEGVRLLERESSAATVKYVAGRLYRTAR